MRPLRTFRTSAGPFAERPFYSDEVIERMCSDALVETGFLPIAPGPVRIDRFIEKRFNAPIIYEVMDKNVLGFTAFGSKGVEEIHIAEPEEQTQSADRRVNSTLAHEAGHGIMHAHLFALDLDHGLFSGDADVTKTRVLCRDPVPATKQRKYDGRWWELQANRAIGALLLPKSLFLAFVEPFLEKRGMLGTPMLPASKREEVARAAANVFEVNPAVARIRVEAFFPEEGGQLTL
jgi:hypothetical protein